MFWHQKKQAGNLRQINRVVLGILIDNWTFYIGHFIGYFIRHYIGHFIGHFIGQYWTFY